MPPLLLALVACPHGTVEKSPGGEDSGGVVDTGRDSGGPADTGDSPAEPSPTCYPPAQYLAADGQEVCNNGVDDDGDGSLDGCAAAGVVYLEDVACTISSAYPHTLNPAYGRGDIDGDGIDDFAMHSNTFSTTRPDPPGTEVWIFRGGSGPFPESTGGAWAVLDPHDPVDGSLAVGVLATFIVPDLDGDGTDELLVATDSGVRAMTAIAPGLGWLVDYAYGVSAAAGESRSAWAGPASLAEAAVTDGLFLETVDQDSGARAVTVCRVTTGADVDTSQCTGRLDGTDAYIVPVSATADLDGDGIADLVAQGRTCASTVPCDMGAPDYGVGSVRVYSGPLEQHLDLADYAAARVEEHASAGPTTNVEGVGSVGTEVVDLDGDGAADLAVVAAGWNAEADPAAEPDGKLYLLHGPLSGTGSLGDAEAQVVLGVEGDGRLLELGDLGDSDGDGRRSLAVVAWSQLSPGEQSLFTLEAPGSGTFDLVQDAESELVLALSEGWLWATNGGTFGGPGDFDGNGALDLLLTSNVTSASAYDQIDPRVHVVLSGGW